MLNDVAGVAPFTTSTHIFTPKIAKAGNIHKPLIFTLFYNLLQLFTLFYIRKNMAAGGTKNKDREIC
jgi:hypothetical protein